MPSSTCRRRRRRNRKKPPLPPPAPAEAARDWAALPQDILLTIFLKLGDSEQIMQGAELVCKTWRSVAVDEPMLWQRVDMGRVSMLSAGGCAMGCAAIDRGAGQCESFSGRHCSKDLLLYLVER
jgi:transposase InsO family protein